MGVFAYLYQKHNLSILEGEPFIGRAVATRLQGAEASYLGTVFASVILLTKSVMKGSLLP